ncbi:DUF4336 domain-containing protein [Aestuariirhabdus sp. Z084]|uniref:DUF4336 domain-containing protein n=1 Tax=Aestuariirhabdus haliotis TaxID=2918751 RepID=UPI00201B35FF|nr:DUF4336 domain-containing protein [Aestuariirhabdus haliotis]MCL6415708.1 DUF4336 domain-containing protein [Aestuariirhabdus haliotis]MCL6419766.1 DUF4336 domain-containing protein [Aestuariirhabdus haliotis]
MEKICSDLWVCNGTSVPFLTIPFSTRMVVIRLPQNKLWVHSPIALTEEIREWIDGIGDVQYLIAPNHLHHLFLHEWQQAYPSALTYGTEELIKKRSDLVFSGELTTAGHYPWKVDIEQLLFTGSPLMQESVFLHVASKSLIVTDLIENFSPDGFSFTQRILLRLTGILAPNGRTPIDWRFSFLFGRNEARRHYDRLLAWKPVRIIMAHGEIIETDAEGFLKKSFAWLRPVEKV